MRDRFRLRLDAIQPSQLYISAEKLAAIEAEWDASDPDALPPIPIKRLDGREVATDGHTRGVALLRAGYEETWAVWDEDDLDWEAYRICVDWCRDAGLRTMHDLVDRIVDPDAYQRLWLDRCRRMHERLEDSRNDAQDTD
jgi:hypothetical protein